MESKFTEYTIGWARFTKWYRRLLKDVRISSDYRAYIARRVEELVMARILVDGVDNAKEFWNSPPIGLGFLWKWTDEDVACGVRKASELGH